MKRLIRSGAAALASRAILLVLLRSGCRRALELAASWTPFYRVQVRTGDVKSAPGLVARAIAVEVSRAFPLEEGYPQEGRVELVDSGEGPGIKRMTCVPTAEMGEYRGCLLLNAEGDLVEVDLWDQPIALFFPYVLYLLEPGATLDFGETPRVTVRFNGDLKKRSLLLLHQAVEKALLDLGAAPLSWKQGISSRPASGALPESCGLPIRERSGVLVRNGPSYRGHSLEGIHISATEGTRALVIIPARRPGQLSRIGGLRL